MICRTTDYGLVREILCCPDIYSLMGDDFLPPIEEFRVNRHPDIWYLEIRDPCVIGLFSLFPYGRVCWELHVAMLPSASTRSKWQAARQLPGWLAANTECKRLTGAVPAWNRPGIIFCTHGIGMRYVGRHERAFMKHGKLQDLVLLGLSIWS